MSNRALKIIATILERPVIEKIRTHQGLDPRSPPKTPTREAVPHLAARAAPAFRPAPPQAARIGSEHGAGAVLHFVPA